jgi:hypothetical protein
MTSETREGDPTTGASAILSIVLPTAISSIVLPTAIITLVMSTIQYHISVTFRRLGSSYLSDGLGLLSGLQVT